jgi:hypothetical protein
VVLESVKTSFSPPQLQPQCHQINVCTRDSAQKTSFGKEAGVSLRSNREINNRGNNENTC